VEQATGEKQIEVDTRPVVREPEANVVGHCGNGDAMALDIFENGKTAQ
jgi:hypothetical protein